ncbi:MAG TPA: MarR family winged helix-turn-helix transcriptional regulator [Thermoplasmataceae archaeon]|nr:MarR family winged helix-turn-helix transcriptional regulator [Thermoplasmatales archaeon AK]HLH85540.1 MarR family winged helix-turn-helix transcriptional regulator [Thermoplasmataceae archaeon]
MRIADERKQVETETGFNSDSVEIWNLFTRLFLEWRRSIERNLGSNSIKPVEIKILKVLEERGETPVAVIADRVGVTSPWVTASVNRLVQKGLARKIRSESDKRVTRVSITPNGIVYLNRMKEFYTSIIRNAFDSLTEEERKSLTRVLIKIEESLRSQF